MSISKDSSSGKFTGRRLRFGTFEVDFDQRELRNQGIRVHLQKKPFQILELLLRRPGALVTRAELAQHLWPGLHVSFGTGLNTAINVLRQALGDSSTACRFIETRPGLGYRFLASVEEVQEFEREAASDSTTDPTAILPFDDATGGPAMNAVANRMTEDLIASISTAVVKRLASSESVVRGFHGKRYTSKAEAYQDYLKGKYLQSKMTEADLGKSIAHFESAIAQDPSYALAYTGLAGTYTLFPFLGMLPSTGARSRAEELTMIALQIDDQLAEAHASLACIRQIFDQDYPAAEWEFQRALQLSPNFGDGHRAYAAFLSAVGRHDEALNEIRNAQELDPLSPMLNVEAARVHFMARKFHECIQQAWQTLVLEAEFAPAQHMLGLAYEQVELYEEAITELQNAQIFSEDDPAVIAALGHAHARAGRPDQAGDALSKLDDISQRRYVSPCWRSIVYVGLGAKDLALEAIDKAFEDRDVWLIWLKVEPRFDPLRADRSFTQLLERAGFNAEIAQAATNAAKA